MIRICILGVPRLRCSTTPLLHDSVAPLAPLALLASLAPRLRCSTTSLLYSLRSLRYIGLVVIVNAVVSKLAFGAFPTLLTPPFPAAPIIPTVPEDTLNAA